MAAPGILILNLREFNLDLKHFGEQVVPANHLALQKKLALDLLTKIVLRTPVGNPDLWQDPPPPGYVGGRARGNWQVGLGVDSDNELSRIDAAGGQTIGDGAGVIGAAQPFGIIWIYNNVPYIVRLETGWSTQAPNGMVALSLAEVEASAGPRILGDARLGA